MTTQAQDLRTAVEAAERALSGMYQAGGNPDALEGLAAVVADLKAEHDSLPHALFEQERNHCPDCAFARRDCDPEALGSASWHTTYECEAGSAYDCPVVRACGFRDPATPESDLPGGLTKRQAI